jgi:hypothetical protein
VLLTKQAIALVNVGFGGYNGAALINFQKPTKRDLEVQDSATSGKGDVICLEIAKRTFERTRGDAIEPVIDCLINSPNGNQRTYRPVGCFFGATEKEFKDFAQKMMTLV